MDMLWATVDAVRTAGPVGSRPEWSPVSTTSSTGVTRPSSSPRSWASLEPAPAAPFGPTGSRPRRPTCRSRPSGSRSRPTGWPSASTACRSRPAGPHREARLRRRGGRSKPAARVGRRGPIGGGDRRGRDRRSLRAGRAAGTPADLRRGAAVGPDAEKCGTGVKARGNTAPSRLGDRRPPRLRVKSLHDRQRRTVSSRSSRGGPAAHATAATRGVRVLLGGPLGRLQLTVARPVRTYQRTTNSDPVARAAVPQPM